MEILFNNCHKILLVFCCFWSLGLTGQILNYQSAELTQDGRVITGFINQLDDASMNKQIAFKESLEDEDAILYSPQQVSAYTLTQTGTKYQTILHKYVSLEEVMIEDLRFARVIVESEKYSLYRVELRGEEHKQEYSVSNIPDYVYYVRDAATEELRKLEVVEKVLYINEFKVIESYKGALRYLFKDWQDAEVAIDKTAFKDDALIQLFESYHKEQDYMVSNTYARDEADFKENNIVFNLGYMPFAIAGNVDQTSGYLLEMKYEYFDGMKKYPVLQLGVDYMNLNYDILESTGRSVDNKFNSLQQIRFSIGPKQNIFQSKQGLSLYVRAAVGACARIYKYQYRKFDAQAESTNYLTPEFYTAKYKTKTLVFNMGTGMKYKNILLDLGLERVTYSFSEKHFAPVIRIGYNIKA